MDETKREELKKACRKEKDPMVAARMLAVHTVYVRKAGIDETAAHLMRSARWVRNWLRRYDEGGLEGLRDLPRSGRPRRIPRETIEQIINKTVQPKCTPAGLQKRIHEETGTKLHITYIRKIMRMYDLSPKESQRVHINRAGKKAVQNWQYRFKKQVPRLEKDGFVPVMGDEAFFIHDTVSGRKYWSLREKRIAVPYTGSHKKVAVYGAIAKDGRQFFRTYDRFDAPTFVEYLKAMQKHFGKVAAVVDRASPPSGKTGQEATAGKQEHQDHIPPKRITVPQCGRGMLAPGKTSPARLRILQDLHGHVQCNLHVL